MPFYFQSFYMGTSLPLFKRESGSVGLSLIVLAAISIAFKTIILRGGCGLSVLSLVQSTTENYFLKWMSLDSQSPNFNLKKEAFNTKAFKFD